MFYFLMLILNFNLFSLEIVERNVNYVSIKFDNVDTQVYELYESKNGKDFDKDISQSVKSNGGVVKVNKLKPSTYYKLKGKKEITFWTLAEKPKKNKESLMFLKADNNAIKLRVNQKDADGVLVLASLKDNISLPESGKKVEIGRFGELKNKIGETFIVGDVKGSGEVVLSNLKYEIYNFALIAYNGSGETINYSEKKGIIQKYHPQLAPPKPKECEYFKENVAEIKWDRVEGTEYYEVIVAEDPDFLNVLVEYENANFGNGDNFKIYLEDEQKKYYWKIKAVGIYNTSSYSDYKVIDYNYINSAKK